MLRGRDPHTPGRRGTKPTFLGAQFAQGPLVPTIMSSLHISPSTLLASLELDPSQVCSAWLSCGDILDLMHQIEIATKYTFKPSSSSSLTTIEYACTQEDCRGSLSFHLFNTDSDAVLALIKFDHPLEHNLPFASIENRPGLNLITAAPSQNTHQVPPTKRAPLARFQGPACT